MPVTDQLGFAHDPTVELESAGATKGELFAIERVVVVASPFFATASAWVSGTVAANVPGVQLKPTDVRDVMIATVFLVAATIIKWLHGRQKPELIAKGTTSNTVTFRGAPGVQGPVGPTGDAGPTGDTGLPGQTSLTGDAGVTGAAFGDLPPIPGALDPAPPATVLDAPAPATAGGAVVGQA